MSEMLTEVPPEFFDAPKNDSGINMNEIVGTHDILFVVLDSLRYDIAIQEQDAARTPQFNKYGQWIKCDAPANFTYPSHHAMFAGFMPKPLEPSDQVPPLFFPKNIGLGMKGPKKSFAFDGATWIQGLEKVGYDTLCIGGVSFFDNRSDIGKVFPAMFKESYWHPSFSCIVKESPDNQIDFAVKKIQQKPVEQRIMMYMNIDAIHYPSHFYVEGAGKGDNTYTHAAALQYVDARIETLIDAFRKRSNTFVILCSDHGTCYGEDGKFFHSFNHEITNTIPYMDFVVKKQG